MKNKVDAHVMSNNLFNYQYSCCDRFDAAHPDKVFARVTPKREKITFILVSTVFVTVLSTVLVTNPCINIVCDSLVISLSN